MQACRIVLSSLRSVQIDVGRRNCYSLFVPNLSQRLSHASLVTVTEHPHQHHHGHTLPHIHFTNKSARRIEGQKVHKLHIVAHCLVESNSNFGPAGINSELLPGRMVCTWRRMLSFLVRKLEILCTLPMALGSRDLLEVRKTDTLTQNTLDVEENFRIARRPRARNVFLALNPNTQECRSHAQEGKAGEVERRTFRNYARCSLAVRTTESLYACAFPCE